MDLSTAASGINGLSVIVAAIIGFFILGGIWYGPLFGRSWMHAWGFTEDVLAKRSMPKVFGLSFVLALIAALNLELFIGSQANLLLGATAGFLAGFGWVATLLGILYLFEQRSLKLYFINAGYCVVSLTLMGAVLGAW